MRKHIFFKKTPDKALFERLLNCFGIEQIGDNVSFTKEHLVMIKTLDKFKELVDELRQYYIPCKARIYLENLTVPKCITVLRQIMRLYSCYMMSIQKMKFGVKSVYYTIIWPDSQCNLKKQASPCVLTFT